MLTAVAARFLLAAATTVGLVATAAGGSALAGVAGPGAPLVGAVVPAADPSATVTLQRGAKGTRLVVVLSGASGKVRTVIVRVGGREYPVTGRAASWRSQVYAGRAGRRLLATAGTPASVRVTTSTGTSRIRATVTGPASTTNEGTTGGTSGGTGGTSGSPGGGGGGATDPGAAPGGTGGSPPGTTGPLFTPPAAALTGQPAADWILPFLLNSQFSDCAAGPYPACAVEYVYTHCPTNSQSYQRITSLSGPDINAFGQFQLTGAQVGADGSWVVEYHHQLAGAENLTGYRWEVSATGQVVGAYWYGVTPFVTTPTEILGPFRYRQHACSG